MEKTQQISDSLGLAVILTLSGGFMDAYSYLCRGMVFANAQTGNILLFGIQLSKGDWHAAAGYLFPILSFALGIAAAQMVRHRFGASRNIHWRQITVLSEALLFFIVAFLPQELNFLANAMISFACGAQVQSFQKVNGIPMATTMCIGNLRAAVHAFCDFHFQKDPHALRRGLLLIGIIAIFACGAVLGDFFVEGFREHAIFVSCFFMLLAFLLMRLYKEEAAAS